MPHSTKTNLLIVKVFCLAMLASLISLVLMPLSFALLQAVVIGVMVYMLYRTQATSLVLPLDHVQFSAQGEIIASSSNLSAPLIEDFFSRLHEEDKIALLHALATTSNDTLIVRLMQPRSGLAGSLQERVAWLEGAIAKANHALDVSHYVELSFSFHAKASVALLRDVTQRERETQRVQTTQAQTAKAQEMKTQFLATITHELRTPLNAVIGFSQMLLNEDALARTPEKRLEYATLIHEAGDHLLSIVNSILDMSKLESGKFDFNPDYFNLHDVLENCHAIMRLKVESKNIRLFKHIAQDLPEIYADKRAIRQILLNLMSNAVKFTQDNGTITTHVQRKGNALELSVADTGIGISDEDLAHLGEAFYQAKSNYDRPFEGTGLGLSIVKGLVALHKGEMKVTSTLGEGTIFTLTLPLATMPIKTEVLQQKVA